MSDALTIALIAATPPTLVAVANLIATLRSSRNTESNGKKLDVIHDLTNSLSEKREEKAEELGHMRGMKEESEKDKK